MSRDRKYKSNFNSNNKEEGKIMNMNKKHQLTSKAVAKTARGKGQINKALKYAMYGSIAIGGVMLCVEPVLASGLLDKALTGATTPLVAALKKYYPYGIAGGGVVGTIMGQGDTRQKVQGAAIGAGAATLVCAGLIAMLGDK